MLYEAATRRVIALIPPMSTGELESAIVTVARELLALGVVAAHDPGKTTPDPDLEWAYPGLRPPVRAGRAADPRPRLDPRTTASTTALAGGLRSGDILGADPAGRARIGWQKAFADGSLGSRTAALLADIEPEPDRPLARGTAARGLDHAAGGAARARRPGGRRRDLDPDPRHRRRRGARRARRPDPDRSLDVPFMPKIEHVQLIDPADVGRFAAAGIVASVQPVHLGSDAIQARRLWGDRAEKNGYVWRSISETGAVMAFGTDAPVESFDPWPGIALAVRREDRRWPAGTAPFGPDEALTLDRALRAACVDPAISAREGDRGRLTVGQRADVVVIPAAAIDDPVEPGGALATARPSIVLLDGRVVFER